MNIDIVLFAGRIVLVALLYIFLFAVMKTGVGLVRGQRRDSAIWTIDVDKGPRGIRGIHVNMLGPVIVGRSPSSDICINEPFVSASHARFSLQGPALIIEDLNSLNGTLVNGRQLVEPAGAAWAGAAVAAAGASVIVADLFSSSIIDGSPS